MPFFRVNSLNVYFAHVPKCGGSSVEHNLRQIGIPLSFLNVNFSARFGETWSASSPQHIPSNILASYIEPTFFDYKFTVIRDPVARFVSAFNFNRGAIGWLVGIDQFLTTLETMVARRGRLRYGFLDNHFLPADELVPDSTEVFFLEDGLSKVFHTLELRVGLRPPTDLDIVNSGRYSNFHAKSRWRRFLKDTFVKSSPKIDSLSAHQVARIRSLYKVDYQRFFESHRG